MAVTLAGVGHTPRPLGAQLPGVTPPAPPGSARVFELRFANDFLGRGGAIDDFRTQELTWVARVGPAWTVVVDHSILTFSDSTVASPGRVDHVTVSGSRRLVDRGPGRGHLEAGVGLRYSGDAAGSRIQNGFHQLVGSTLETMPYVGTDRVDGVFWIAAPLAGQFTRKDGHSLLGRRWTTGWWLRSATLVSTDAEWDGSVAGLAVVSRGVFQGWVGVRGDWRTGHDRDPVTRATADFESGGAGVLGLRVGPLVLETAQGFDGETAYGHLSFLADGNLSPGPPPGSANVDIEAGFTFPDVTARVQARWRPGRSPGQPSGAPGWRRSLVLEGRFGQPQFGTHVARYVDTRQFSASLELEPPPIPAVSWIALYGGAGAGWRQERLEGFGGDADGLRSGSVGTVGLTADLGFRVDVNPGIHRIGMVLQTGLTGWLPATGRTVEFAGESARLLDGAWGVTTGVAVRIRTGPER